MGEALLTLFRDARFAAAIRKSALESALALVKYKLVEPSLTVSVFPCVNVSTPVELLYANCVLFSLIALLALASVKYKLLEPSLRLSVSLLAKSVLKLLVAYPLIVVGSNLLLLVLYAST